MTKHWKLCAFCTHATTATNTLPITYISQTQCRPMTTTLAYR